MKHDPTLMDPDPARRAVRIDFLCRAIDLARQLEAGCVSLWSGILADPISEDEAMDRLAAALRPVLDHAEASGMPLAFEPEPGMFVDTFHRFDQLDQRVESPAFPTDGRPWPCPLHRGGLRGRALAAMGPPDRQRPHRGHGVAASTST